MKANDFRPLKARMRATFAAGETEEPRVGGVDREHEVLSGVQITLEGEAKGHGVWLDRQFCEAVVEAGNATGEAGVKVRFGHPGMCADALGTYLGRATNFRLVELTRKSGEQACGVLADVAIASESHSAPKGDLGKWILDAAENSPDTFGQSIVFTYADIKSMNDRGEPILRSQYDSTAAFDRARGENRAYAVLGKLHGSDFTDTPAATDGVFSADSLAAQAEELIEENPEIAEALAERPDSVCQFLARMGILDKLESKRVSGMQAEKDKEIAALKAEIEAGGKRLQEVTEALTLAKAEASSLRDNLKTSEQALAQAREQFGELKAKHDSLCGSALNPVAPRGEDPVSFAKAVDQLGYAAAARKYPELAKSYRRH